MHHNRLPVRLPFPGLSGLLILLCILSTAFSAVVFASADDTQQPIHIEADRAEIDEPRGVMTYTGHVILRQGAIEVRADTLMVFSKNGELQRITAQGQPVHYRQQRPNEELIRGVSQRMIYSAEDKQVLLLGQAEFWQGPNRFSGNRIQYDPAAERVIASAGEGALSGSQKAPRVSVTIQPKTNQKPRSEPGTGTTGTTAP